MLKFTDDELRIIGKGVKDELWPLIKRILQDFSDQAADSLKTVDYTDAAKIAQLQGEATYAVKIEGMVNREAEKYSQSQKPEKERRMT
jgi:hypothetical protein